MIEMTQTDYELYVAFCKRTNKTPCSFEEFKCIRPTRQ